MEMVLEVQINEVQLEAEKINVETLAKETTRDQNNHCIESLFYTSFREHQMGQPKFGNRDTVKNLTVKDLQTHIKNTFTGSNFTVVATGNVAHDQIVDVASKWLNKLPERSVTLEE